MSGVSTVSTVSPPSLVSIRDVGPRDGLQVEAPVSVESRVQLINALINAGVTTIEVCSFVSPKAVPSMADGALVLAEVPARSGLTRAALVPNLRGAQLALAAGIDELTVTVSASAEYSMKNTKMTIDEAVASVSEIVACVDGVVPIDVIVSCAFGSPYEAEIAPSFVASLAERLLDSGASRLTFADTTGMAMPRSVEDLLGALTDRARVDVGLHLHETRGTALLNAFVGMQCGVARFDTSIGGLGGSPFAEGAAGNLATEDFVHLCDSLGITTGISLPRLLEASKVCAHIVGHSVPSRIAAAGPAVGPAPLKDDHAVV
jgi:hydroxymethylglutaryl-CoA lyase